MPLPSSAFEVELDETFTTTRMKEKGCLTITPSTQIQFNVENVWNQAGG